MILTADMLSVRTQALSHQQERRVDQAERTVPEGPSIIVPREEPKPLTQREVISEDKLPAFLQKTTKKVNKVLFAILFVITLPFGGAAAWIYRAHCNPKKVITENDCNIYDHANRRVADEDQTDILVRTFYYDMKAADFKLIVRREGQDDPIQKEAMISQLKEWAGLPTDRNLGDPDTSQPIAIAQAWLANEMIAMGPTLTQEEKDSLNLVGDSAVLTLDQVPDTKPAVTLLDRKGNVHAMEATQTVDLKKISLVGGSVKVEVLKRYQVTERIEITDKGGEPCGVKITRRIEETRMSQK